MANYTALERMVWFDQRVKVGTYPNATTLSEQFEISTKTAQRCIDFMRDRYGAPLEYDKSKRGYIYTDTTWELPHFMVSQEEILSILIARNLLSKTSGGAISRSIGKFKKKLFSETVDFGLSEKRLGECFSASWTGHAPSDARTFSAVVRALLDSTVIEFTYDAPGTGETTRRAAEPHHLQYYMASWVMTAWCNERAGWRKFYLSRMRQIRSGKKKFIPHPAHQWRSLIDDAFGIFQGKKKTKVVLHFSPFRARWIKEQRWHTDQKITEHQDGSVELILPVTDFREIKLKILQFGADVKVIRPKALEDEIRQEIQKMALLYSK